RYAAKSKRLDSSSSPKAISGATLRIHVISRSNRRAAERWMSSCSNFRSRCESGHSRAGARIAAPPTQAFGGAIMPLRSFENHRRSPASRQRASGNAEPRAETLAAMREIYDGSWTRHLGSAGGKSLTWKGKVAIVFAATEVIDAHHAVIGAMGDRFL